MDAHVHLPKVIGTVGLAVVVGGAYYGLSFGVTVGLTVVVAALAAVLTLLAGTGERVTGTDVDGPPTGTDVDGPPTGTDVGGPATSTDEPATDTVR